MIVAGYFILALVIFVVLTARRVYLGYGRAVAFEIGVMHAIYSLFWPAMVPYWLGIGIGRIARRIWTPKNG